jgi:hypothetical protein
MASHLPRGHRSVAMRNFAQVLHPHLRQRPVAFSAAASHSGHARHVASRVASASGGVVAKPAREKPATDLRKLENCGLTLDLLIPDILETPYHNQSSCPLKFEIHLWISVTQLEAHNPNIHHLQELHNIPTENQRHIVPKSSHPNLVHTDIPKQKNNYRTRQGY